MEQPIWLIFGIIAALIGLGIIIAVVATNDDSAKLNELERSLDKLETQCSFVCSTTKGNFLSVDTTFPSGSIIYAQGQRICTKYHEDTECRVCNCAIQPYELDLNTTLALKLDRLHYKCFFEKLELGVEMECHG